MSATSQIQESLAADQGEVDLIQRAQNGSADAFGELVRRYQMDVRWFLCRKIYDWNAIDDLAQEVFMAAMRQIPRLKNNGSLRQWLMSIANKKSVDYLRAKSRQPVENALNVDEILYLESLSRDSSSQVGDLDETEIDSSHWMSALSDCIRELAPNGQSMLRDFYFENQTAEQIGKATNRKPGTVRMALLRIRKLLGKCLKRKTRGIEP